MVIDLQGPDGNAYYLRGVAKRLSKEIGLDFAQIEAEMTSGDYSNLIAVFEKHFGNYATLINKPE